MKLKTLKDLNLECWNSENRNSCSYELRQEAIKWTRFGMANLEKSKAHKDFKLLKTMEYGVRHFIMDFFNITEEDLE